jgi:hypothetical protein
LNSISISTPFLDRHTPFFTMASRRLLVLAARTTVPRVRPFSHSSKIFVDPKGRQHDNVEQHRSHQKEKPLNPHLTNTTSTLSNEVPNVGKDSPPPELLSSIDGKIKPKDESPEHAERMTGGTQKAGAGVDAHAELNVGELEGASFRVEPLRRTGEDVSTMRARLLCLLLPISRISRRSKYNPDYTDIFLPCRPKPETRNVRERASNVHICQRESRVYVERTTGGI